MLHPPATADQVVFETVGLHSWHAFEVLSPGCRQTPLMRHSLPATVQVDVLAESAVAVGSRHHLFTMSWP